MKYTKKMIYDLAELYDEDKLQAKLKAQTELDNQRKYKQSGLQRELISIGKFPVYVTVYPREPEGETPWGTIWEEWISKDEESNIFVLTSMGWVDSVEIFNGDPVHDKSVTYEYIKEELERYELEQKSKKEANNDRHTNERSSNGAQHNDTSNNVTNSTDTTILSLDCKCPPEDICDECYGDHDCHASP